MRQVDRKPLITVDQFRQLARPTSIHLEEEDVLSYVRECEDERIIPAIGWGNFKSSLGLRPWDSTFSDSFIPDLWLDGGEWTKTAVGSDGVQYNKEYYCSGVRKALAYFVYAKMLRADGTIVARAGTMRHRDDYSDHLDDPQIRQYNDVMDMAERYLGECLYYLNKHKKNRQISPQRGSRARIHVIGD